MTSYGISIGAIVHLHKDVARSGPYTPSMTVPFLVAKVSKQKVVLYEPQTHRQLTLPRKKVMKEMDMIYFCPSWSLFWAGKPAFMRWHQQVEKNAEKISGQFHAYLKNKRWKLPSSTSGIYSYASYFVPYPPGDPE